MAKSFGKTLKRFWWAIVLLAAGLFLAYTFIRYPLKTTLSRLAHMDPDSCRIVLWHWGKEAEIADENARTLLLDSLDGELKRRAVGDWIMKTAGGDWVLKLSDGEREVQLILYPGHSTDIATQPFIKYGHYEYAVERMISYEKLNWIFEDAAASAKGSGSLPAVEVSHERLSMYEAARYQYLSVDGIVITYVYKGQNWDGAKGEPLGMTEAKGSTWTAESLPAYRLPNRSDYTYVLVEQEGALRLYTAQAFAEEYGSYDGPRTFGLVLNLFGADEASDVTRVTIEEVPGWASLTDKIEIRQTDDIEKLIGEFRELRAVSWGDYNIRTAATGVANYLEGTADPGVGRLRERTFTIYLSTGHKLKIKFDPVSGYMTCDGWGVYEVPEELRDRLIELAGIEMDVEKLRALGDESAAATEAFRKIDRRFITYQKGVQDGGYYAGASQRGTDVEVWLTDAATEEDIAAIKAAAGYDKIVFRQARYTYSELGNTSGRISKDAEAGLLPFVVNNRMNFWTENRVLVEISENTPENLRKLMEYVPDGNPAMLHVMIYEPLPLLVE